MASALNGTVDVLKNILDITAMVYEILKAVKDILDIVKDIRDTFQPWEQVNIQLLYPVAEILYWLE